MDTVIRGICYCCGDNVTVYQVIPEERWTMNEINAEEMSNWVFETVEPGAEGVSGTFKSLGMNIVIAGQDFGCGSKSVEHPMAALKGAGVKLVIADSFSRYSYRNAINLGLPVLTCPGITNLVNRGDDISVDLESGEIVNHTTNARFCADGLSEFALKIIRAGGLLEFMEQERTKNE